MTSQSIDLAEKGLEALQKSRQHSIEINRKVQTSYDAFNKNFIDLVFHLNLLSASALAFFILQKPHQIIPKIGITLFALTLFFGVILVILHLRSHMKGIISNEEYMINASQRSLNSIKELYHIDIEDDEKILRTYKEFQSETKAEFDKTSTIVNWFLEIFFLTPDRIVMIHRISFLTGIVLLIIYLFLQTIGS